MISRAVATSALLLLPCRRLLEQLDGSERLGRPRPEAIEGESSLLTRFDVHQRVVVLLLGRLPLPVEVRRIVCRELDARAPRENRILLRAATAKHQVFHAVDVEQL